MDIRAQTSVALYILQKYAYEYDLITDIFNVDCLQRHKDRAYFQLLSSLPTFVDDAFRYI
ncbi:hypothetical protein ACJMK2_019801 [Sinanodonta woodiana]|uniref:Uncharacterized protein n=1 Tax=Sinanodonta woodiana TaxID=1069815 RepID=A0ABD3TXZ9_SINWO